jgi:hypothetical protein
MSELLYQVRGRVIRADELPQHAEPAKPRIAKEREAQHYGFAVEGYPPEQIAAAEAMAREAFAMWQTKTEDERRAYLRGGNKKPRVWEELLYIRKTKPKRIAKPYSMRQSAAECMALAIKAGWQYVRVTELIRESA